MDRNAVEQTLASVGEALAQGGDPDMKSFWKAVAAAKRDPEIRDEFADRIGELDRAAFERWALVIVPAAVGTALMVVGTLIGFGFVLAAYYVDDPWSWLFLLAGTGITLTTTHGLAHQVVGALAGMKVTHWFIGSLGRPQPGVKLDYATYLRAPARARAWMHASGAIVTKLVPFLALGPALVIPVPTWVTVLLVVAGIGMIVTDVLWSTSSSDWKKFRREMRYAG